MTAAALKTGAAAFVLEAEAEPCAPDALSPTLGLAGGGGLKAGGIVCAGAGGGGGGALVSAAACCPTGGAGHDPGVAGA